jgi:putative SOS response-associated peptidase YedK
MPVILDKASETVWTEQSSSLNDVLLLLKPSPSEVLKAHTVSPLINDRGVDRNTPDVIKPYAYNTGNLLF